MPQLTCLNFCRCEQLTLLTNVWIVGASVRMTIPNMIAWLATEMPPWIIAVLEVFLFEDQTLGVVLLLVGGKAGFFQKI